MENCGRKCFFAQIGKYLHRTKEDLLKAGSEELDTWKATVIKCVEDDHWPNNAELCITLFYTNIYTNKVLKHQVIEWQPSHFRGFFQFLSFQVQHPEKSDALQLSKMIFVPFLLVLACLLQSWNWCRRPWQVRKKWLTGVPLVPRGWLLLESRSSELDMRLLFLSLGVLFHFILGNGYCITLYRLK